jgi:hypothetical protein
VKKFFIITLFVLISSITVAAQTAAEQKSVLDAGQVEFAKRAETPRDLGAAGAPIMNAKTKTSAERRQVTRVVDGRVLRLGPTTTYLKNGLSTDEVVRLLGKPESVSERHEGNSHLLIYAFPRADGRVFIAEFENGLLVNSRMEPATSPR